MINYTDEILNTANLLLLLPVVAGLFAYRKLSGRESIFFWYWVFIVCAELVLFVTRTQAINNQWMSNVYAVAVPIFLTVICIPDNPRRLTKNVLIVIVALMIVSIPVEIALSGLKRFNVFASVFGKAVIVLLCWTTLQELSYRTETRDLLKVPIYLITWLVLVYELMSVAFILVQNQFDYTVTSELEDLKRVALVRIIASTITFTIPSVYVFISIKRDRWIAF